MRVALTSILALAAISLLPCSRALAQSVANPIAPSAALTGPVPSFAAPRGNTMRSAPELTAATGGSNFASTLQIGHYNNVTQAQLGAGNISNVGIINGVANNVGVMQAGNGLKSNVGLINTQGLNVGVIQPNGSAPVNVLVARLPNGALLIAR